ncbi:unannotated protein [freshwater metagenome]|uniref:Unannotated protein n=1 Tax=freshwater metagenome TaxID=449393 RepID=A0A6J6E9I8_9ZZZZ
MVCDGNVPPAPVLDVQLIRHSTPTTPRNVPDGREVEACRYRYMHGDTDSSPSDTSHDQPGPTHDDEPRSLPNALPSSCVTRFRNTGVAVVRAHNGPKAVGIHAVAVTGVHHDASTQNQLGTFTTIDADDGANETVGFGSRA